MTFSPVPKPTFKKRQYPKIPLEQTERTWIRSKGFCECGCDTRIVQTESIVSNKAELHHIEPRGHGGRPKKIYLDWELIWLSLVHHDLEESEGYPHRESWKLKMKQKMEVL